MMPRMWRIYWSPTLRRQGLLLGLSRGRHVGPWLCIGEREAPTPPGAVVVLVGRGC